MCGRYVIYTDDEYEEIKSIIDEVSEKYKDTKIANGEVFPTNSVLVIYNYNGRKVLSAAKWGFPNFNNSGVIINARAETVAEKSTFRKSFATKRCIIPANGYYEWLTEGKTKTKYLINPKEEGLFFMAGLYNLFNDSDNKPYAAVTIVTTDSNEDVSFIHNRMPVILNDKAIELWLNANNTELTVLQNLLNPYLGKMQFKIA